MALRCKLQNTDNVTKARTQLTHISLASFCGTYTRQKKKGITTIFPLSSPFNAKMLLVMKCLFLMTSF